MSFEKELSTLQLSQRLRDGYGSEQEKVWTHSRVSHPRRLNSGVEFGRTRQGPRLGQLRRWTLTVLLDGVAVARIHQDGGCFFFFLELMCLVHSQRGPMACIPFHTPPAPAAPRSDPQHTYQGSSSASLLVPASLEFHNLPVWPAIRFSWPPQGSLPLVAEGLTECSRRPLTSCVKMITEARSELKVHGLWKLLRTEEFWWTGQPQQWSTPRSPFGLAGPSQLCKECQRWIWYWRRRLTRWCVDWLEWKW